MRDLQEQRAGPAEEQRRLSGHPAQHPEGRAPHALVRALGEAAPSSAGRHAREGMLGAGGRPVTGAAAKLLCIALLAAGAARGEEAPRVRSIPTSDGGAVTASEWGSGTRGVVLAHGAVFDRTSWDPLARRLAERGLRVLALDLRRDASGRPRPVDVWRLDVRAGIEALRGEGAQQVSVVGASLGGRAAADCLTEEPIGELDRVVLLAPAGARAPEKLPGRKLVVLSRDEPAAAQIRQLYERMPEPKELEELPDGAHAQHVFRSAAGPALEERLIRFLSGTP